MTTVLPFLRNFLLLFALTVWGGMVFFFTFVVAPAVFASLDRDAAARLLGALFPKYFLIQLGCIGATLVALLLYPLVGARLPKLGWTAVALLAIALVMTIYANFSLMPRMAAAQARVDSFVTTGPTDPARVAYGRLHGQAMVLNAVAALLGAAVLASIAFAPGMLAWPGTAGAATSSAVLSPSSAPAASAVRRTP